MNILKNIPRIGIGPININLPKEAISGKVPAWLIWSAGIAMAGVAIRVVHLKNERDREAKIKIAKINASKSRNSSTCINEANSTNNICETICTGEDEPDIMPEWVDAASIEDKPLDSTLIAQSGALVLIKAREGHGKSTLVNQLLAEACGGASSNLFPDCDSVIGPKWNVFLLASESSPKFKSNFGVKLAEYGSRFKVTRENFTFKTVDSALTHIRQLVINSIGNCAVGIDNITDMFPKISSTDAKRFIHGLKAIRKEMNSQDREITFIIVVHANIVTGEAAGSSVWQNLGEVVISLSNDKNKSGDDYKIVKINKSRFGACKSISVRRIMTPYMHFEYYSDSDVNVETTINPKSAVGTFDKGELKPITTEVEDFMARIYEPETYGYERIYKDYKTIYPLKNKDHVRNIINRAKKRMTKVA